MDIKNPSNGQVYRAVGQSANSVSGAPRNSLFGELRVVDNTVLAGWRRLDGKVVTAPKPIGKIRKWQPYAPSVEAAFHTYASGVAAAV